MKVGRVGAEQHQCGERGRADRIALGHRLGGVADRVERVGAGAHVVRQAGHFGNAAGIVGDRTVGVERHDHAGQRQHRGRAEGDADHAGDLIGRDHRDDDDERRQRGGFEADRQTLDHVGAVAGLRGLGDRLHRTVVGAGIIFGDPDQRAGQAEADQHAPEQLHAGQGHEVAAHAGDRGELGVHVAEHILGGEIDGDGAENRGGPGSPCRARP